MPAGGYQVDLTEMNTLITTLDQAKERMTAANGALAGLTPADLGSYEIDHAATDFKNRWHYGIGKIADFCGGLVDALNQVKQLYNDMETKVAAALGTPSAGAGAVADGGGSPATGVGTAVGSADDGMVGGGFGGSIRDRLGGA